MYKSDTKYSVLKDLIEAVSELNSDSQIRIIKASIDYLDNGVEASLDGLEKMAFRCFKPRFDAIVEHQKQLSEQRKKSITKRWSRKKKTESETIQKIQTNTKNTIVSFVSDVSEVKEEISPIPPKEENNNNPLVSKDTLSPLKSGDAPIPARKDNIPYQQIVDFWNSTCTSFHKLTGLSEKRKNKLRVRFEELEKIGDPILLCQELFKKMQNSSFLKGDNRNGWKATFDWLISNGENWRKVMEGNYNEEKRPIAPLPRSQTAPSSALRVNDYWSDKLKKQENGNINW